jgi:hypothetical protein
VEKLYSSKFLSSLIPLLIGTFIFWQLIGYSVLNPQNVAWLNSGKNSDMLQNYVGWHFFRNDVWRFPLGDNPNWGIDISNSIVYSDSIPLFAIFFKTFVVFLPETFQYFGFWLLCCFCFQALFAWKILSIYTKDVFILSLATVLIAFSPIMLFRVNMHLALAGHFLILASIYLYLKPSDSFTNLRWSILFTISTLIHAYYVAMIMPIYLASLVKTLKAAMTRRELIANLFQTLLCIFVAAFMSGYFVSATGETSGPEYGIFRWNLAGPLYPSEWSFFTQTLLPGRGNDEGFSYLGMGVLLLVLIVFFQILQNLKKNLLLIVRHNYLFISIIVLMLFAMSNNIAIGNYRLHVELPDNVIKVFSYFRSSGRMIWPVLYLGLIFLLVTIIRNSGRKFLLSILVICACLQIIDLSNGWREINFRNSEARVSINSYSSQWIDLREHYDYIRVIPDSNHYQNAIFIGELASTLSMKTNAVYLARVDMREVQKSANKTMNDILFGEVDHKTLLILLDNQLQKLQSTLTSHGLEVYTLDGLNIVVRTNSIGDEILRRA